MSHDSLLNGVIYVVLFLFVIYHIVLMEVFFLQKKTSQVTKRTYRCSKRTCWNQTRKVSNCYSYIDVLQTIWVHILVKYEHIVCQLIGNVKICIDCSHHKLYAFMIELPEVNHCKWCYWSGNISILQEYAWMWNWKSPRHVNIQ